MCQSNVSTRVSIFERSGSKERSFLAFEIPRINSSSDLSMYGIVDDTGIIVPKSMRNGLKGIMGMERRGLLEPAWSINLVASSLKGVESRELKFMGPPGQGLHEAAMRAFTRSYTESNCILFDPLPSIKMGLFFLI